MQILLNISKYIDTYLILFIIIIFIFLIFNLFRYILIKYSKKILKIAYNKTITSSNKIKEKKIISYLYKKYPKTIKFLKDRLEYKKFIWLSLSILILLIIYIFSEFIWFTNAIINDSIIKQIDIRISNFFYYFKDIRLSDFFININYLWDIWLIIAILIFSSTVLLLKWKKIEIIWLYTSIISSAFILEISKIIIKREVPELAILKENSYSFPSFHALISISLYSFILYLFFIKAKKIKNKYKIIYISIFSIFLIWLSRLYLNLNYFSDIISWYYLWIIWLSLWISIIWTIKYKLKHKEIVKKINKKVLYLIIWIFLWFISLNYFFYKENIIINNATKIYYSQVKDLKDHIKNNIDLKFSETITWRKTEAINFIFLAKDDQDIIKLFKNSWWEIADKLSIKSIKKMLDALLDKNKYESAPMTPLYLNKKIQDYWFQKLTDKKDIKYRHHIRVWKSDIKINDKYIYLWVWVYDDWLKYLWITHKIDPNLDKEREYILNDFINSSSSIQYELVDLLWYYYWSNFSKDHFYSDWKAYIINIF